MPVYDYVCNDCHKTFELILTLKEHEVDAKCQVRQQECGARGDCVLCRDREEELAKKPGWDEPSGAVWRSWEAFCAPRIVVAFGPHLDLT